MDIKRYIYKLTKDIYNDEIIEDSFEYKIVDDIRFSYAYKDSNLILIFRGTSNISNFETDKDLFDNEIPKPYPKLLADVMDLINKYKPIKIIMGGHSLGGSIVQLMSKILCFIIDIEAYTFNAYGDRSEKLFEFNKSKHIDSIYNILGLDGKEIDVDFISNKIYSLIYNELYNEPIIKISKILLTDINDMYNIVSEYQDILSRNKLTYNKYVPKTSGKIDINVTDTFKIQLGIGDINAKNNYEFHKGKEINYDTEVVSYYGLLLSILYLYNRSPLDVNLTNFIISGDMVGTNRDHNIGKVCVFGNDIITKFKSNHSIELFDKYIS